jgi:hypothetical protein
LVVNMTSASGGSRASLEKANRVVITATKSGNEKNATVFARFWVEALRDPSADTDKNETVSALEAFTYAEPRPRSSTKRKSAWPPSIRSWKTPGKATASASRRPRTAKA